MVVLINNEPAHIQCNSSVIAINYELSKKHLRELSKQRRNQGISLSLAKSTHNRDTQSHRGSAMKKSNSKSKSRNISFAEDARVYRIEGWRELSTEEYEGTWFVKKDYDAMKFENETLGKGNRPESFIEASMNGHSSKRGIEKLLDPKYHIEKKKNKRVLFDAIRIEQGRQRVMNINNPDLVRSISRTFTKASKIIALKRAEDDAKFVRCMVEEEEEDRYSYTSSVPSYEEDTRMDAFPDPVLSTSTERTQPRSIITNAHTNRPQNHVRSASFPDLGVVEYTPSVTGIDVELYDDTCPRNALLYASKATKDLDERQKEKEQKKKSLFGGSMGLGEYMKCGAFQMPHVAWRKPHGPHPMAGGNQFAIYDSQGKRLWSSQNQRRSNFV